MNQINSQRSEHASRVRRCPKNFLEKRTKQRKLRFRSIAKSTTEPVGDERHGREARRVDERERVNQSTFMKDIAPAISPPAGIGDAKPVNQAVLDWVQDVAKLTQPENIFWCDGSERENDYLLGEACRQDILIKLNDKKIPRSYLHRSNPNDVARVEQFTFICTPTKKEAGPTNNWSDPAEMYMKLHQMLKGAMRGRTMFVIPYIRGPPDSPLTKVGFEITAAISGE